MAEPIQIPPDATDGTFRPELRDFADRFRWIRAFELRLNSIAEMARRLGRPTATVTSWENGVRPHDFPEVARKYHDLAPHVPLKWILYGAEGDTILTKGDADVYADGLVIVDEAMQPFPNFDYPPARIGPELTLV